VVAAISQLNFAVEAREGGAPSRPPAKGPDLAACDVRAWGCMRGTLGEAQASLSKARPIWLSRFRREDTICDTSAIVAFDWPLGEGNDGLKDGLAGRRLDHELTADPPQALTHAGQT
jgi:hypothetical protein